MEDIPPEAQARPVDEDSLSEGDESVDDYQVGYGKPPKEHQFTKGKSGNPRGRPRGAKNKSLSLPVALNVFAELLREAFEKPLTVVKDGRREQIPALRVVLDKLIVDGVRGNFRAQKLVAELAKSWGAETKSEKSERIGMNEVYKERWGPVFEAAQKRGAPEPSQLPHPAHLHFVPEEFDADLRGPLNAYEKADWDQLKDQLRWIDDSIEHLRSQLGTSRETPDLHKSISRLQRLLKRTEARVRQHWNWRECVTDVDRAYYQRGVEAADRHQDEQGG